MPRFSLRLRLVLLVFLAAVPPLGVTLYNATEQREQAVAEVRQDALRLARFVSNEHSTILGGAHQFLAGLAELPDVQGGDPEACLRLLTSVVQGFERYLNLGIIGPGGSLLCSGQPLPPGVTGELGSALAGAFREAKATRGFAVSDFAIGRVTRKPVVMLAHPAMDGSGRVRSVLFASLDLDWLNTLAAYGGLPRGSTLTVTDRQGHILVRHPESEGWIGEPFPVDSLLRHIREGGGEATRVLAGPDGERRLYALTEVYGTPEKVAGYVSVGIPVAAAYAPADASLRRNLLILAALAALALAAAWLGGDLFIVRRVNVLVAATRRLQSGDLGARAGLHGNGELDQLGRAFDEMAASLQLREEEARAAAKALRESEEQLRQSQKMEAIGRLAGGIAHDFNNILTAIKGSTQLALLEIPEDAPVREDLEQIDEAATRAATLTHQLLAFSRKQVLEPRVLDLNVVVSGTEKMLRRLLGADVEMVTVLDPHLGRVRADPGQMEQVLVNLAVNARDAMPGGGRLVIRTADTPDGRHVMLSVTDTGEGMAPELQKKIFEPFFTTKEVGKGTGLGLSTVYGIVRQSGGQVRVESEPGRGSTFRVLLPRLDAEEETPEPGREHRQPRGGTETVLVVEDEASVRDFVSRVLAQGGYRVLEAEGGESALRLCRSHTGPIHLLLTDVLMPRMGGSEVAARALEIRPDLRVLYMSGHTDETVLTGGGMGPAAPLLRKPFSLEELMGRVETALDAPPLATESLRAG